MAIRLSGLASGLDTEAIIKEMMSAQSMKKTKIQNKLTKLEWTQDIWKDTNAKLYGLYTTELSKFKAQSSYLTKSVTSSDSTKATFKASSIVPSGTHTLEISEVASAQFITGSSVKCWKVGETTTEGTLIPMSAGMKITDLQIGMTAAANADTNHYIAAGTKLTLRTGNIKTGENIKESSFMITEKTTISDISSWCKSNGVNFSYDSGNQKFFLSSMQSGDDNSFTLTSSENYTTEFEGANYNGIMFYNTGLEYLNDINATNKEALKTALGSFDATTLETTYSKYVSANDTSKQAVYVKYIQEKFKKITEGRDDLELKWSEKDPTSWTIVKKDKNSDVQISTYRKQLSEASKEYDFDKLMRDTEYRIDGGLTYKDYYNGMYTEVMNSNASSSNSRMNHIASALTDGISALEVLNVGEIVEKKETVTATVTKTVGVEAQFSGAVNPNIRIVQSRNMKCTYNGAEYVSSSNSLTINGLTINAIDKTTSEIKITVVNDTQNAYDTVKNFVKKYNEILKELNEKYNAKPAKGYDVLTDEQKEKMTDKQVEKWEDKIKDSLLRRDNILGGIISTLQQIASQSVEVNGKKYNLTTFGINTGDYSEKGLLHIDGDAEDPVSSINEDKLLSALSNDPDTVMQVLTTIGSKLFSDLQDKMASTKLSSALTFYNDKEMTSLKKDYEDQIKNWDKKLKEIEDRYYKKFSAMEAAMSKMNSQTNYISSMLGGQ